MNQAADVTFSNPPYTQSLDLRIILTLKEAGFLKKLICVHPSNWLVRPSYGLSNTVLRKFKTISNDYIESIEMFNGNIVFGIKLFVPCIISIIDFSKKRKKQFNVKFLNSIWSKIDDINDVTLHNRNWFLYIKEFNSTIIRYVKKSGSINDYHSLLEKAPKNKFYIQMANIRGNVGVDPMIQEDFYTFFPKDTECVKGIRKDSIPLVYAFDTELEQNNFWLYLQTDFARLCLSLIKTSGGLGRGEIALVPWLDFSQEWDDDKLFSFFGYAKGHPIREYAKSFLPDYHNLYPNGKVY
jgi:hypothetical protein